jgi:hypothetical protein
VALGFKMAKETSEKTGDLDFLEGKILGQDNNS